MDQPSIADGLAAFGAESDGENAHAAVGGHPRRFDGVGACGPLAIGKQNDRGRGVGAGRYRFELFLFRFAGLVERHAAWRVTPVDQRAHVDAGIGENRRERNDDAAADGGAALQLEAIDGGDDVFAIMRGYLHDRRRSGEGHHADAYVGWLLGDEGFGRGLGRG